jgi:NAD(P)-dependent dehydrogenase (short-subunit alcohol dehydrogenase family)
MKLNGRTAVVTGGSSGIGRGIAIEMAREGANVVVADAREQPKQGKYYAQEVSTPTVAEIESCGTEGLFVQTDVADENQVRQLIERTVKRFGGIDILVNNAGIHIPCEIESLSMDDWDRVTGVNYRGTVMTCRYAVSHLQASPAGRIINISSIHALAGGGGPAYPGAKAAVVNLTRDLAVQLGKHGITANSICPGFIETAIQDYLTPEDIELCRQKTPLPRFGKPADIGRACVFLASDDAEWITGSNLIIDGGWVASLA